MQLPTVQLGQARHLVSRQMRYLSKWCTPPTSTATFLCTRSSQGSCEHEGHGSECLRGQDRRRTRHAYLQHSGAHARAQTRTVRATVTVSESLSCRRYKNSFVICIVMACVYSREVNFRDVCGTGLTIFIISPFYMKEIGFSATESYS